MIHCGTQRIETERLVLRRFSIDDAEAMYHNRNTDFRSYFISFADGARLELMTKPKMVDQEKSLNRTGYAHIAFSVGSKDKKCKFSAIIWLYTPVYFLCSSASVTFQS